MKFRFAFTFLISAFCTVECYSQLISNEHWFTNEGELHELVQNYRTMTWAIGSTHDTVLPDALVKTFPKSKLYGLDITSMNLKHVPQEIGEIETLEYLSLQGDFNTLPSGFENLKNLQALVIPASNLTRLDFTLPSSIVVLTLVVDSIFVLTQDFPLDLINLEYFSIGSLKSHREVRECVISNFCNLSKLVYLEADYINIDTLPSCFAELDKIEYLSIPIELGKNSKTLSEMKGLRYLCVDGMNDFNDNISLLNHLQGIYFYNELDVGQIQVLKRALPDVRLMTNDEIIATGEKYFHAYHK